MSVETPEISTSPSPPRACARCGSALAPAQDWCLECGTAAPGRLAPRSSWRAATTIVATVLLLVGGAVAASYAALNSQTQQLAAAPPPPSAEPTVAAPPPAPAPSTPAPPPAPAPAPTPAPAPKPAPAPAPKPTPTPAPAPTSAPAPKPAPKPKPTGPAGQPGYQPLALGVDVASVYDPYKSATDQTDPADSYDNNGKTVFTVSTAPGQQQMAVGLEFDLQTPREVGAVYLRTTTPGFGIEVYGTKGRLPPDILDNRWEQLARRSDVGTQKGKNGLEKITFPRGTYRHIVLWFTTPPPAGPTVGISEVSVLD